jgi:hypothetical protein
MDLGSRERGEALGTFLHRTFTIYRRTLHADHVGSCLLKERKMRILRDWLDEKEEGAVGENARRV